MADTKFYNIVSSAPERAVIEIDGTIGGWDWEDWKEKNTGKSIRDQLSELGDVANIDVLITSLGGDCDYALQIHDALKDHPATVTTIINGFCASAATIIALAGDVRKISKNALYLIHKCSSGAWGNEHDLAMVLESQRTMNDVMFQIYKTVCKKTDEELANLFNYDNGNGKWITAQEAVDFGFCDEIYNDTTSTAKVAMADTALLEKLNYPKMPTKNEIQEERLMNKFIQKARELFAPKPQLITDHQNSEQMEKLEELQKQNEDLKAEKAAALAEVESCKSQLAAKDEEVKTLQDNLASVTAERDDYKQKWENAPAQTANVKGTDNSSDFDLDEAYYAGIENELTYM